MFEVIVYEVRMLIFNVSSCFKLRIIAVHYDLSQVSKLRGLFDGIFEHTNETSQSVLKKGVLYLEGSFEVVARYITFQEK